MKRNSFTYLCIAMLIFAMLALTGCGGSETTQGNVEELPTVKISYVHVDHQSPLFVAGKLGEEFKNSGTYLNPIIDKEQYELISDGKKVAIVELVAAKSGSEAATLFAQNHIDMALFSITAAMAAVDSGTPIKVLGPIHTEGLGLVFPAGSNIKGWDAFLAYVKEQNEPVKIGYHSPTSAPKIVFEGALHREGINFTADVNDLSADILMVDLKSTSNLIAAMNSGQVDGWVGPSPHPQVAETTGAGEIVLDLRDLPPAGYWHDFPCCIVAASDSFLENNQEVAEAFMKIMTNSAHYCNEHRDVLAQVNAEWIGVPLDAAEKSTVVYTTNPNENWVNGAGIYLEVLNNMGNFKGSFQNKKLEDVKDSLFYFDIVKRVQ